MSKFLYWFQKFSENSQSISTPLKWFFGWPLSIIAIYFILRLILANQAITLQALTHVNIETMLSGSLCLLMYFVMRVKLWEMILRGEKIRRPFRETAYFWTLAELKRYVPGNVWSIVGRVEHFANNGSQKKTVLKAYVHEAQLIVLGSATISILCVSFFFQSLLHIQTSTLVNILIAILLFACCFSLLFSNRWITYQKTSALFIQGTFTYRLQLYIFSVIAFLFFGLGSFFILIALLPLDINQIYLLSGFLVLSYLVGYLSFITPSGLGVREALLTYGLTKVVNLNQAALGAIFSRTLLVICEIIFFGIVTLWYHTTSRTVKKIERLCKEHPQVILLFIFILLYIIYFTLTSFLRYDNYYTGRFDLGNMAQTIWDTQRGRIFELTDPNGTYPISRLATHADFLLILLVPFYWIWSDPRMLLLVQTVILSLGALFVYLIALKILHNKSLALVFAFAFLLNPSVQRTNLYDFHAVTLATTFLLAAYYFILEKRLWLFLLFGILAGLTKEQVWFIVGLMAFYAGIKYKRYLFGVNVFLIMAIISYYLVAIAIPKALGAQHFALSYYSDFGDTPSAVLKNIFFSPAKTAHIMLSQDRPTYLLKLFSPLAFLSLLSPLYILFSLPELGIYLLSNNGNFHQIYYQYTATITPFVFISGIYGLERLRTWMPKWNITVVSTFLILIAWATAFFYGPLPGSVEANTDMFTITLANSAVINTFLSQIPKRFSVAASNNIGSHLSQRRNIYTIPVGVDKADIVAFLLTDPGAQPSPEYQHALVKKLRKDHNYIVKYENGPFIVFVKISDRTYQWAQL